MTDTEIIADVIVAAVRAAIAPYEQRLKDLEAREYQGIWRDDRAYAKGAMVTHAGSIWHSNVTANRTKPGDHEHWTLAVKHGRDLR